MHETSLSHKNILEALNQIDSHENWQLDGPVIRARESNIYRALGEKSSLTLAIKHYHSSENKAIAQQQFKALLQYQTAMTRKEDPFRVPKVYTFDRDRNLLIMEWVNGRSLHQFFWTFPKALNSQTRYLQNCGRWLRTFHENSSIEKTNIITKIYLDGIEKEISKRKNNTSMPFTLQKDFESTYNHLEKVLHKNQEIIDFQSTLHGDFTPHNLIIKDQQTTGVDIWARTKKPITMDISRMLVYLTVAYPLFNFNKSVFGKNGNLNKAVIPLINGYGQDTVEPCGIHFKMALLSEYLRRWLVIEGREKTFKRFTIDKFQILQIKKNIKSILSVMPEA